MADGGSPYEELPTMGVENKLGRFVGELKNTAAAKINQNLSMYGKVKNPEQYDFEEGIPYDLSRGKYGGHLNMYQAKNTPGGINNTSTGVKINFDASKLPPVPDVNSDKGTTNNYYYGQQNLPPEYNNNIDYLYGRPRPLSDFNIRGRGMAGNYRSTGWLKDEYGMDKLRDMGLTAMSESNPKWHQFFKRPTKTYYFGQQGQESMGSLPGQVDPQGMPVANQQGAGSNTTSGANQSDPGKGMGFFGRLFQKQGNMAPNPANITKDYKDLNPNKNTIVDTNNPAGWNPYMSDFRNQIVQNRRRRTFDKLADLTAHETWQKDMLGKAYDAMDVKPAGVSRDQYSDIGLQGWRARKEDRLINRALNLDRKVNAQRFQGEDTSSEKESRREKRIREQRTGPSSYQQYRKPMTLDEYNRQKEIEARDKAGMEQQIKDSNTPSMDGTTTNSSAASTGSSNNRSPYMPAFDEQLAKDIIRSNEQKYFRTKPIDEMYDPNRPDWRSYAIDNFPGKLYENPNYMDSQWTKAFGQNGVHASALKDFDTMPAPLKTVAADMLYNSGYDPRAILMAAAGVESDPSSEFQYPVSMAGQQGRDYRNFLRKNVTDLWNKNKDMILQQYNDDPRAFTDAFSDYRDVYYQNLRTKDQGTYATDTPSTSGAPGTQYNAWSGRTDNTRRMVDDRYFGPNSGYVAPEFASGGSYNAGDVVDMTPEELERFIEMGGQVEFLD
ncbi:MAG: hypothetical protein EBU90_05445 [Proteobacteria bacterium]|nr:hypothetical protein [Pseudomonadota bacterium]